MNNQNVKALSVEDSNFTDAYMPPVLNTVDKNFFSTIEQLKKLGHSYSEAKAEYLKVVEIDQTQEERRTQEIAFYEKETAYRRSKVKNTREDVLADVLMNIRQKTRNGHLPTEGELSQVIEISQSIPSVYSDPAIKQVNKDEKSHAANSPEIPVSNEDPLPDFFAPGFETERMQSLCIDTARQYYQQNHKPHFALILRKVDTHFRRAVEYPLKKALQKSMLSRLDNSDRAFAQLMVALVIAFDIAVWYAFGTEVLLWSVFKACLACLVPIVMAKVIGPLLFKKAILENLKNGTSTSFKGKKLFIGLFLAVALGVGLSLYTSKKILYDQRQILMNTMSGLIENEHLDNHSGQELVTPIVKPSWGIKLLHDVSTVFAVAMLGLLSLFCSGYLFTRLEIISPIVRMKNRLRKLKDEYSKTLARAEVLVHGRKEGVRLAACIEGKKVILKAKTSEHLKSLFPKNPL